MPLFVKDDEAVLFVHIPRAGGTTLKVLFEMSGYQVHLHDQGGPESSNRFMLCSPQHMHAESILARVNLEKLAGSFVMVRHPMDRFVSEYRYRLGEKLTPDPGRFEAWAARVMTLYGDNPYLLDNHIRPQSEFLVPGATLCRFEDGFDKARATLEREIGVRLIRRQVIARSISPAGDSGDVRVEITDRLRDSLAQFYAVDFERFGYEP